MNRLILAAGLFSLLASTSAFAQSLHAKADVPFSFQIGNTVLPAGSYLVNESGYLLTIHAMNGKSTVMQFTVPTERHTRIGEPVLQFQRYGSEYFLDHIWAANSREGITLFKSKRERELAPHYSFTQTRDVALATISPADRAIR